MVIEQEINLLANKYGEKVLEKAIKDYLIKSANSELKQNWDRFCSLYDFDSQDFGKQFTNGKNVFTLKEIKPRNRKYPIIAESENGGMYKFSASSVKFYLQKGIKC